LGGGGYVGLCVGCRFGLGCRGTLDRRGIDGHLFAYPHGNQGGIVVGRAARDIDKGEDVASVVIGMSQVAEEFDEASLRRRIGQRVIEQRDMALGRFNVGRRCSRSATLRRVTASMCRAS